METRPPNLQETYGVHVPQCRTCHNLRLYNSRETCVRYFAYVPPAAVCDEYASRYGGSTEPTPYELEKLLSAPLAFVQAAPRPSSRRGSSVEERHP